MIKFFTHPSGLDLQDRKLLMADINWRFDTGNWCYDRPAFQTHNNLLDLETGQHWQRLKESHATALKTFDSRPITGTRSWAYKNCHSIQAHNAKIFPSLWHDHRRLDPDPRPKISSILYLLLPKGARGTEYQDGDSIKVMPHEENSWTFFPSDLMHRPGYWCHTQIYQSRIIISIDSYF